MGFLPSEKKGALDILVQSLISQMTKWEPRELEMWTPFLLERYPLVRLDPEAWVWEFCCGRGCSPKRDHGFHPGPELAEGQVWMLLTIAARSPGLDSIHSDAIWTSHMSSSGMLINGGTEQHTNSLQNLNEFGSHSGALGISATPLP